ncbi:ABC transporter substrate-binding protein [Bradyrhizobium prioriisuperbiae]|uniref:ABC transporter substrate-binding protein n=1 Tax=Bradyrhizobium prioriisuperbiae TaxID=2854389 RepID=UPI0028EEC490|nr:ABC transporter substrate-binding protein [Bradyrhizobium prioritasuperba]
MKATAALLLVSVVASVSPALAQKSTPGVTDTEIRIGNTMPYSGPVSAFGLAGRVMSAYFDQVNGKGGINGRKLNLLSLDDAFSPPKTVEAVRRLVESDNVAFIFGTMGTAPSSAVAKYLNINKVPQIFLISTAAKWNDPVNMPWSIALPWGPNYLMEAAMDVQYARAQNPNARFAVLYQNDDAGKEYLRGVREALGADADKAIAMASSFEVADPTVDSQVLTLASTKADVFMIYSVTPRACAQAIRKAFEAGWLPLRFISSGCANTTAVMAPAGLEASAGILSLGALKPYDAETAKDPGLAEYTAFMRERFANTDPNNSAAIYGYYVSQALVVLLERCGNDLSRENIMAQATSLKNIELPMLMPGITLNTSKDDFRAIKDGYMVRFDGSRWSVISERLRGN